MKITVEDCGTSVQNLFSGEDIDIYPNPASENIMVSITSQNELSVEFEIFDLTGRKVICLPKVNVSGTFNNTDIDIS